MYARTTSPTLVVRSNFPWMCRVVTLEERLSSFLEVLVGNGRILPWATILLTRTAIVRAQNYGDRSTGRIGQSSLDLEDDWSFVILARVSTLASQGEEQHLQLS
jgi:hypothetical protein